VTDEFDPGVVVVGDITIEDVVFSGGPTFFDSLGGDSIYSSVAARIWDVPVAIVTRSGPDLPASALEALRDAQIDTRCIRDAGEESMRLWVLYERSGERQFLPQGAGVRLQMSPEYSDIAPEWLARRSTDGARRVVHVAGMSFVAAQRMVAALQAHRPDIVLLLDSIETWTDEAPAADIVALAATVDVFLPSYLELAAMTGIADAPAACDALLSAGVGTVLAKLGSDGALLCRRGEPHVAVPAAEVEVVDPTGAGDSFCGGFAAGLALGDSLLVAARRASASAAASVGAAGSLSLLGRADLAHTIFDGYASA
jgi:ribokinase